jgi:hypothetical protein
MPKRPNKVPTKTVTISTTPQVWKYLGQLVSKGIYGKTEAEVAERLVSKGIDDLIDKGRLR